MVPARRLAVLLALPLLVSGVAPVVAGGDGAAASLQSTDQTTSPPDPSNDTIGWENGYWHNESIDVSQTDGDGLTAAEQRRLLARTMARVERLRGLEFTENVTLTFVSREQFRRDFAERQLPPAINTSQLYDTFTGVEGFWEATFIFGEDTSARERIATFGAEAILGYSAEEGLENEIVVVTRSTDAPAVAPYVLAHELVHALQGQHFDLGAARYRPTTHDGRLGKDGIVEGAAAYVDSLYQRRCERDWECLETPRTWTGRTDYNGTAYPLVVSFPYADGAPLVHDLVEEGGWEAVASRHDDLPTSSEQVIHRRLDEAPRSAAAPDRSGPGWDLTTREVVGEVTIFTTFWTQSRRTDPDTVDVGDLYEAPDEFDSLNYESQPSAGWGGDRLLLYRSGDDRAYVWYTVWDSSADAAEFATAYRRLLDAYGGERRGEHTWVIPPNRAFGDAFHVVRNGTRVRIVNAPTVDELSAVHGDVGTGATPTQTTLTPTASRPTSTTTEPPTTPTATRTPNETPSPTTDAVGDGFGALIAIGAVLAAAALAVSRGKHRGR